MRDSLRVQGFWRLAVPHGPFGSKSRVQGRLGFEGGFKLCGGFGRGLTGRDGCSTPSEWKTNRQYEGQATTLGGEETNRSTDGRERGLTRGRPRRATEGPRGERLSGEPGRGCRTCDLPTRRWI